MDHKQIAKMYAEGRKPTYARIVVDFRLQKADPNRVRITAGGNLIKCPGDLTTRTADLTTSKIIWNSVISTEGARFGCLDVSNFYIETPMERYDYMQKPLELFHHGQESNITRTNMHKRVLFIGKSGKPSMGFLKQTS